MLMPSMRRCNTVQVLILAIAIAGLPILHSHPAIPGLGHSSLAAAVNFPCAVCATANARVTVVVPQLAAPEAVVAELVQRPLLGEAVTEPASVPARAPPSA